MNEITVHPNVYSTGRSKGLLNLLERIWVRELTPGDGTIYIVSGFANYNGGVRFFETFREHCRSGGELEVIVAGSTNSRLSSRQVVEELLQCGARVHVVNRKRLLHMKSYGVSNSNGQRIVVSSANFTGPGMSQNVEMSASLDKDFTASIGFDWNELHSNLLSQNWQYQVPELGNQDTPAWQLLYDEQARVVRLDETEEMTMVLVLSHFDTVRINAQRGTSAAKGTQYFLLSKDSYDFFPPLVIRNSRGQKATYSCLIQIKYMDLGGESHESRVTFEAENNLDFRLGTSPLRYTELAEAGDIVALSRVGEYDYELRLFRQGTEIHQALNSYAIQFVGNGTKRYGYLPNQTLRELTSE